MFTNVLLMFDHVYLKILQVFSMFDFTISLSGMCLVLVLATLFVPGGADAVNVTTHYLWLPVLLLILVTLATGLGLFFSCAKWSCTS